METNTIYEDLIAAVRKLTNHSENDFKQWLIKNLGDKYNDDIVADELIYETGLLNSELANRMKQYEVKGEIYADSAEPKSIEELHRFGWNIKPTAKGQDSINAGIDILKRHKIFATSRSNNLIKELQNYKWTEDKNGNLLNKPIDVMNHALDASRYAVYNKLSKPNYGRYSIR